jgi:ADP-L-glycero-D-manno-heptose 6-epimerase
VCDRLGCDEKWRNLRPLCFEDFITAEDLLSSLRDGSLGKFDCILHMGACSSTAETDAGFLFRNNYQFTKDLAEWALAHNSRFVYASSAATYGDGSAGMSDSAALDQFRPLNAYGYSKHLFDLYAQRVGWLQQFAGMKYFNIFGPNESHKGEMRSVVHKGCLEACNSGVIRLFKRYRPEFPDGQQKRDFLYVKDAVEMTLHVAANAQATGLFNVGSGQARTWNDLAASIFQALGKSPRVEYIEMPDQIRPRYQYSTQADITRLRQTGFDKPIRPLEESVEDYICGYILPDRRLGEDDSR